MEASKVLIYLIMIGHAYVKGVKTLGYIFFFISSSSNDRTSVLVVNTITFLVLFWKMERNEVLPPIAIKQTTYAQYSLFRPNILRKLQTFKLNYPSFFKQPLTVEELKHPGTLSSTIYLPLLTYA